MYIDDTTETLVHLGLSINQAKVYLKVGSSNFSSVCEIQKKAGVPRQEIYRILEKLSNIGLVESTIQRPRKYKSISVKEGISFLLRKKNEETKILNEKAERIIKNADNLNNFLDGIEPDFVLIPKNQGTILRKTEEIYGAIKQIDFLISWKRLPSVIDTWGKIARTALEKGVKIRVLLEKPEDENNFPEKLNDLMKYSNYKLKFISYEPSALISIFDKKKIIMDFSTEVGLAEKSSLLSNNPSLVSIIIDYFEKIWEEIPVEEIIQN